MPDVVTTPMAVEPVIVDGSDFINDDAILAAVGEHMRKIKMNKDLQKLADENGLNIKNSAKLNEQTEENLTIAVIALLLAQKSRDPRYADLVRAGMKHRELRTNLINAYKNSAIQIVNRYKNDMRESGRAVGFVEYSADDVVFENDIEYYVEAGHISYGWGVLAFILGTPLISLITILLIQRSNIQKADVHLYDIIAECLKEIRSEDRKSRKKLHKSLNKLMKTCGDFVKGNKNDSRNTKINELFEKAATLYAILPKSKKAESTKEAVEDFVKACREVVDVISIDKIDYSKAQ